MPRRSGDRAHEDRPAHRRRDVTWLETTEKHGPGPSCNKYGSAEIGCRTDPRIDSDLVTSNRSFEHHFVGLAPNRRSARNPRGGVPCRVTAVPASLNPVHLFIISMCLNPWSQLCNPFSVAAKLLVPTQDGASLALGYWAVRLRRRGAGNRLHSRDSRARRCCHCHLRRGLLRGTGPLSGRSRRRSCRGARNGIFLTKARRGRSPREGDRESNESRGETCRAAATRCEYNERIDARASTGVIRSCDTPWS